MKTIVCIKQVVSADQVKFDPGTSTMIRTADNSHINPNDLFALQMAVELRKRYGGRITAVAMGPTISEEVLYEAMALGVDRGVLLSDQRFAGADTLATSYVLAMGLRRLGHFDLVLCGANSTDSGTGQVGPQLAEEMDIPQVTLVEKVEKRGGILRLERTSDGFREVIEVFPPALLTVSRATEVPRLPSLIDIQDTYIHRKVKRLTLEDLKADEAKVGLSGSGIWLMELARVTKQKSCEFIDGDLHQQVQTLMGKLKEKSYID